ncbi:MAG: hypothetical protein CFH26_00786 [Alphaproteobacteria bacterium MarineAlpha6_Bin4]|nr:MAG: hypothetical protein CFH25_00167 [Alphaproteobacteria bacterium MarineAlpha6_Bin3]PPR37377.1 MAG: hypothetical protein CFH26_00786 [Alphaproteobacteria bacterium MarineAlpha6_Bin4]|tara:strand:+ start:6160 stop:7254 length:1095 start_codon:yes stop_codon:yes gene_type:complete
MQNLEQILKKRILNFGPISLSEFISEANLNSKYGYYNKNLPFGEKKDYITSPEISQMFGELIAIWSIDCWEKMGEPKQFNIIELGPGSGVLMKDFLRVVKIKPKFIENCKHIYLFDSSSLLKKIQKRNLIVNSAISKKIKWVKKLDEIPENPFILIANEFFDALPIKQLQLTKIGWRERMLNYNKKKKKFFISYSNKPTMLKFFLPKSENLKKIGLIYEIPLNMISFLENLFTRIKKIKSACLIIDYEKKKIFGNTLKSIKKHALSNPIEKIGSSDISAHVNFDLIKEISKKYNLSADGPISQSEFLINLGILKRTEMLIKIANNKQKKMLTKSLEFLIDKNKMGKIFKVISIKNKKIKNLVGF